MQIARDEISSEIRVMQKLLPAVMSKHLGPNYNRQPSFKFLQESARTLLSDSWNHFLRHQKQSIEVTPRVKPEPPLNLSGVQLSPSTESLLAHGPKYAPAVANTRVDQMAAVYEIAARIPEDTRQDFVAAGSRAVCFHGGTRKTKNAATPAIKELQSAELRVLQADKTGSAWLYFQQTLGKKGPAAFYEGPVAEAVVNAVAAAGGVLSLQDLKNHLESSEDPVVPTVSTTYRGVRVHTMRPPSHGAVLLEALNILEAYDLKSYGKTSGEYYHLLIEALRLAFADGLSCLSSPGHNSLTSVINMTCKKHAEDRRALIDTKRAIDKVAASDLLAPPQLHTTFLTTVDEHGNACAFINSNFKGFGCTIVEEYGFAVHSRAMGFVGVDGHPNCVGPLKKPYHTLMPVMVTDSLSGDWMANIGCMGGYGQPQINLQVLLGMLELGLNPQEAVDRARVMIGPGYSLHPESLSDSGHSGSGWSGRKRRAGTCFNRGKTPDDPNSPRLLIDTADPSQTHLVYLASIVECQPAAAPRRSVSQANVPAQEELTVGVRVQACGSPFPRQRCVGWLFRAITARVSLRNHPGIVVA
ncbi:hypothetical protein HPB47_020335 [Ixodes persulcatus]|uniref:Uncharacterized protein n=1 Tax=Ixodes persulcatus TaxID=34615 RepID=A0AC60QGP6_IXOPE|nr:hypothetical protein HPB47_020335 [Ixodes persulcatus]